MCACVCVHVCVRKKKRATLKNSMKTRIFFGPLTLCRSFTIPTSSDESQVALSLAVWLLLWWRHWPCWCWCCEFKLKPKCSNKQQTKNTTHNKKCNNAQAVTHGTHIHTHIQKKKMVSCFLSCFFFQLVCFCVFGLFCFFKRKKN